MTVYRFDTPVAIQRVSRERWNTAGLERPDYRPAKSDLRIEVEEGIDA